MQLYLLRHAQAENLELGHLDENRKLTLKGLEQAKALRRSLEHLEVRFDGVISSPWRRARQTAAALESVAENLEVSDLLAAAPSQNLLNLIAECSQKTGSLALVGHQPWMSQLTSLLLTGDSSLETAFEFKKCSLYALEYTPSQAFLRFVLPPGVLRRLS